MRNPCCSRARKRDECESDVVDEGIEHGACHTHAIVHLEKRGDVRRENGQDISGSDTDTGKRRRETPATRVELGIDPDARPVIDEGVGGKQRRRAFQGTKRTLRQLDCPTRLETRFDNAAGTRSGF